MKGRRGESRGERRWVKGRRGGRRGRKGSGGRIRSGARKGGSVRVGEVGRVGRGSGDVGDVRFDLGYVIVRKMLSEGGWGGEERGRGRWGGGDGGRQIGGGGDGGRQRGGGEGSLRDRAWGREIDPRGCGRGRRRRISRGIGGIVGRGWERGIQREIEGRRI